MITTAEMNYSDRRARPRTMSAFVTKFLLIALLSYRCSAGSFPKVCSKYYPRFHLAPPFGWMNDPNGFCRFRDEYHLFYQYNPYSSQEPGVAHWAHAKSSNLIHWIDLPVAMAPDQPYDITGVFSGSAIIENDTMYLYYTGNVNIPGEVVQRQALATSTDGVTVTKYEGNPIIEGEGYQPNIRDPKVWKHGDVYYMILGNSLDNVGRVLLYSSNDLITWKEEKVLIESDGFLGHMLECPDFFELGEYYILKISPQGMQPEGDKYLNLFQDGYIVGTFDYDKLSFEPITQFKEFDAGHDFYATQTFLDENNRRVMVAWFDMWDQVYPERNDNFAGQMTIPRVLHLTEDLRIIQKPIEELSVARGDTYYSGKLHGGLAIQLRDKAAEIKISTTEFKNFELYIESTNTRVSISYDCEEGKITLDRGGDDGIRRTEWKAVDTLEWYILVDASSIELFCGDGEVTFSSRYFPDGDVQIRLGDHSHIDNLTITAMKRTVAVPDDSNC